MGQQAGKQVLKTLVPISVSFITAMVAIIGVIISLYTQRETAASTRRLRGDENAYRVSTAHDVALQQALAMAADGTANNDRRISGIYQLGRFWINQQDRPVLAATLTALLSLPDAPRQQSFHC
jgi:hypothetical protein